MADEEKVENSEKLLSNENEKNPAESDEKEDEKEEIQKIIDESEDDFKGYSKLSKFSLFLLFFLLGIINHLGTILVLTGGRLLAIELDMKDYLQIYSSVATVFSVVTRLINSKLCLKVSYKKRIFFLSIWIIIGYLSMFGVLELHNTVLEGYNVLCFILSFIPCFFLGSSYAFGEAAIVAYLRLFPKTLIAGWSSGTGLSGVLSGILNFITQMIPGFSLKYLYLFLAPCGIVYVILFLCTFRILKAQERKIKMEEQSDQEHMPIMRETTQSENQTEENSKTEENVEDIEEGQIIDDNNNKKKEIINDEDKEGNEDDKDLKAKEDKEMENMNKANQVMSFENLKKVMKMAGRVVINLGLIYFLQFFGANTLLVRVCDKEDIEFLPKECNSQGVMTRKGKYEFINLFFQAGAFIAKTIIKIVRRIKPLEIFTTVVLVIDILFIIEYATGFLHWAIYIVIGLILGFFYGGIYAAGFYTILNSEKILKNYKELTVNVATIANDSGTFLSGLLGFITYKFIMNNDEPFDGPLEGECPKS